jgi:cytochrome P450
MQKLAGIPGPTPSYPLGTLAEFKGAKPWDVVASYAEKYGPMTLIWFGGHPTVVLNDPQLIADVQITNMDSYYKDYPLKAFLPVVQKTIFNLNKPEWTELRKVHPVMMEGFGQWLPTQFPVFKKIIERHRDSLLGTDRDFEPIDKMQRLCFDVLNALACGPDFEDGGFENFYSMTEMATKRMETPQALLIPPISPAFHKAMKLHYGSYWKALAKARQNPDPNANDLLHVYLRHGTNLPDSQIVDLLSEFQVGGMMSMAAGLASTFYLLNANPEVAQRLYSQLTEMIRKKPDYDQAALDEVPLLDHVLRESLRLIPPVPIYSRNVLKDRSAMLGGHELPPDTEVMIVVQALQRSASRWKNPDAFDPSRWENGVVEANPVGSDYFFPFGRGLRMCMGAGISIFCMKIILASILSKASVTTSGSFERILHCGVVEAKHLKARLAKHAS